MNDEFDKWWATLAKPSIPNYDSGPQRNVAYMAWCEAMRRAPRPEETARERLLNQIIDLCERLDDCSAGYAGERIRDDFLIQRLDERPPQKEPE